MRLHLELLDLGPLCFAVINLSRRHAQIIIVAVAESMRYAESTIMKKIAFAIFLVFFSLNTHPSESLELLVEAESGSADAQITLGDIYRKGEGEIQDYEAALAWYRKAAERGDPDGQYKIAGMYFYGYGVVKNNVMAHMWANIAAAGGHLKAVEARRLVADELSTADVKKAQILARKCVKGSYIACGLPKL